MFFGKTTLKINRATMRRALEEFLIARIYHEEEDAFEVIVTSVHETSDGLFLVSTNSGTKKDVQNDEVGQ